MPSARVTPRKKKPSLPSHVQLSASSSASSLELPTNPAILVPKGKNKPNPAYRAVGSRVPSRATKKPVALSSRPGTAARGTSAASTLRTTPTAAKGRASRPLKTVTSKGMAAKPSDASFGDDVSTEGDVGSEEALQVGAHDGVPVLA